MSVRVGINGFGRIGRNVVRAAKASGADIDIVAVNDLTDPKSLAHLFKYDSILGPYQGEVVATEQGIVIDGDEMKVFAERDPGALDWGSVGAEIVIESTGFFTAREDAAKHLGDGVTKVVISAPSKDQDIMVVLGVNFDAYDKDEHHVISNGVVHDELPRAVREDRQRHGRHQARPDDDDPRLHRRPEPAGRTALGPAPRPRRRRQPRPDVDRRREGRRPRAPGARGQAARLRGARPRHHRLARRPDVRGRARDDDRRAQRRVQGRGRRAR